MLMLEHSAGQSIFVHASKLQSAQGAQGAQSSLIQQE